MTPLGTALKDALNEMQNNGMDERLKRRVE